MNELLSQEEAQTLLKYINTTKYGKDSVICHSRGQGCYIRIEPLDRGWDGKYITSKQEFDAWAGEDNRLGPAQYDEIRALLIKMRRYIIEHDLLIGECTAWQTLKRKFNVGKDWEAEDAWLQERTLQPGDGHKQGGKRNMTLTGIDWNVKRAVAEFVRRQEDAEAIVGCDIEPAIANAVNREAMEAQSQWIKVAEVAGLTLDERAELVEQAAAWGAWGGLSRGDKVTIEWGGAHYEATVTDFGAHRDDTYVRTTTGLPMLFPSKACKLKNGKPMRLHNADVGNIPQEAS